MQGHTRIIKADGTIVEQDHTSMPHFTFFQKAVGGFIEIVPYWPVEGAVAFVNEEGKLHGLPRNDAANAIWKMDQQLDYLVGDVIEVTGDDAFMREL